MFSVSHFRRGKNRSAVKMESATLKSRRTHRCGSKCDTRRRISRQILRMIWLFLTWRWLCVYIYIYITSVELSILRRNLITYADSGYHGANGALDGEIRKIGGQKRQQRAEMQLKGYMIARLGDGRTKKGGEGEGEGGRRVQERLDWSAKRNCTLKRMPSAHTVLHTRCLVNCGSNVSLLLQSSFFPSR